jgi:hypothetical protein
MPDAQVGSVDRKKKPPIANAQVGRKDKGNHRLPDTQVGRKDKGNHRMPDAQEDRQDKEKQ